MDDSDSERAKFPSILGFSQTGAHGFSRARRAAIAGAFGHARLDGHGGVALVGDYGKAFGGDDAILAGSGPDTELACGDRGIAFAADTSRTLTVGDEGFAIAMQPVERVTAGKNAIVVLKDASHFGPMLTVGEGTLVIKRLRRGDIHDALEFVVTMPGQAGLIENVSCLSCGVAFEDAKTAPAFFEYYQRSLEQNDQKWLWRSMEAFEPGVEMPGISVSESALTPLGDRIDPLTDERRIILCNCSVAESSSKGASLIAKKWDADRKSLDGIPGLLWGIGNPVAAGFGSAWHWALVQVESYVATAPADHSGHPGAVKFEEGLLLHTGNAFTILEKLIELGADPERLIGQIYRTGDGGHVAPGHFGAAIAGARGWASAGQSGTAVVGENGFAEASGFGLANAGRRGIAISDADGRSFASVGGVAVSRGRRNGKAAVGDRGLAVGFGQFKELFCLSRGAAISTAHGGRIRIVRDAVAIGQGSIEAGTDCVAVSLDGTVAGGDGTLLVACYHDVDGKRQYVSAVVGQDGILPDTRYCVRDGALQPYSA